MLIREATLSDANAVLAFVHKAHDNSEWAQSGEFSTIRAALMFEQLCKHNNSVVLIAIDKDAVVGILVATLEASYFRMQFDAVETLFYIDPAYRGMGNARRMVAAFEQWGSEAGASHLQLTNSQQGAAAKVETMFRRFGYAPASVSYRKAVP